MKNVSITNEDWAQADPEELDYFVPWMSALTSQGLHDKSDIAIVLAIFEKKLAEYKRDAARMNWLDVGNRFVMRRVCDEIRSDHCVEMAVGFYVNGKYKIVEGHTVRAAIDAAMDKTL